METYCVSCKKNTVNKNSSVRRTKQNRLMVVSNCAVCGKKNRVSLKIKNSIKHSPSIPHYLNLKNNCFVLIIFEMISLR